MWNCPYPSTKRIPSKKSQPTTEGWSYQGSANMARKLLHSVVQQENAVQTQKAVYAYGKSPQNQEFYAFV